MGGSTSNDVVARVGTAVLPFITTIPPTVCTLMIGTNDPNIGNTTAMAYANILSWVSTVKAAGCTVIVSTNISEMGRDTFLQTLGALIRGGAVANGYSVADVQSDPNMGCVGCWMNAMYFRADGVHPTQLGYQTIAPYFTAAMKAAGFN